MLWKNAEVQRQKQYDCRRCFKADFYGRTCFWFGGGVVREVEFGQDTSLGGELLRAGVKREMTADDVFSALEPVLDEYEDLTPFTAVKMLFGKVCPQSLISTESSEAVSWEMFCKNYKAPPIDPELAYPDYPNKLVEVFALVSSVRERVQQQEMRNISKK